MTWLVSVVLALSLIIHWSNARCPPADVVKPCSCKFIGHPDYGSGDQITCAGNNKIDLKSTLKRISDKRRAHERHFFGLKVNNSLIEEIENNTIGSLTFDFITLVNSKKLRRIHQSAFANSADRLKYFEFVDLPNYSLSPAPYNLFNLLNSFPKVEEVVISHVNITQLPSEVLKSKTLKRLTITNHNQNPLSLAGRAFYNLDGLNFIYLGGHQIDYLPRDAFKFRSESNSIRLRLSHKILNSSSFSSGWLNNINRYTEVNFGNNSITFLDRSVFQPFLDKSYQLSNLDHNPLNCSDCRNAWLKKAQNKYKRRVNYAYCDGKEKGPTIFDSNFDHCPYDVCLDNADEVFSPCTCSSLNDKPTIVCGGTKRIDLKKVFQQISTKIKKSNQKHFTKLVIDNKALATTGPNVTNDLTFDEIEISAKNVDRIHSSAFLKTAQKVKRFVATSLELTSSKSPYNLFDLLNSFSNVNEIRIRFAHLDTIPQLAFASLNYLTKLTIENLTSSSGVSIGDRPFLNLKNLIELNLSSNRIKSISPFAFNFNKPKNTRLFLSLYDNNLNSSDFGWLNNINKPISIALRHNKITYLDHRVFEPFFGRFLGNRISDLQNNPLNCSECQNAWLAWDKTKYRKSIGHAVCSNGKSILDRNFDHCEDKTTPCKTRPELFLPCTCVSHTPTNSEVSCGGQSVLDLKQVLGRVSLKSRPKQKHFKKLIITNKHISEIAANITNDLTFEEIEIAAENITRIHSDAFLGTALKVNKLTVTEKASSLKSSQKPYDLFDFINSFTNAQEVRFLAPKINQIPSQAFKNLAKLKSLHFGKVILQSPKRLSIANDSFDNLDKLEQLNLKLNRINSIAKKAFQFDQTSPEKLTLLLASNDLNQSSFAYGSLSGFNRPTSIDLNYNKMHYLDQDVFQPFLDMDIRNQIVDLSYNPLNCSDCRNYWLVEEKEKYVRRVRKAFCDGTPDEDVVFDRKMDHCKGK